MNQAKHEVKYGYSDNREKLLKRLKRIEGQVRGVENMVAENRYCIDVLTQISAVQAAMDKVALGLIEGHVEHCVMSATENQKTAKAQELTAAIARLSRRG